MKKIFILICLLIITLLFGYFGIYLNIPKEKTYILEATIVSESDNSIILIDQEDIFYTFDRDIINGNLGNKVSIKYKGSLNTTNDIQTDIEIIDYNIQEKTNLIDNYQDNGIFSTYYKMAYNKLNELTLEEKIGQLILARYPKKDLLTNLETYKLGGYVFFAEDFKNKNEKEVKQMINEVQNTSYIPLLIAVDEEGGKVVRVSSNQKLISEKFKSSKELYLSGGLDKIKEDTINKSNFLYKLGINLNLAPVVDVSTNSNDYMYERSLGQNAEVTSLYSKTIINASKGLGVSYTLKHFPGYGNNIDTHTSSSIDNRSYEYIMENDILPFKSGINAGAEAILVSHNIVSSIDNEKPASLSSKIHNLLRNELNFTGIIITDDLYMGATSDIENASVHAILAGNNIIITTEYVDSINSIKDAVETGIISESLIDRLAFKVLSWKYYKGLMIEEK